MASILQPAVSRLLVGSKPSFATKQMPSFSSLVSFTTIRPASGLSIGQKDKKKQEAAKKKKKQRKAYRRDDLKNALSFSLCDALRYLKAFEVGRNPNSAKYEIHVSFKTNKNSPVVRGSIRVPHAVDTSQRIAVICPPNTSVATEAITKGASLVGEDEIIAQIKSGKIEFERLLLHPDSQDKLQKANVGRILGPKGLMPSTKMGTIVRDIGGAIRDMVGGSAYRERQGVVRMAVGQLAFTPEMVSRNIKVIMDRLKTDSGRINETIQKELHEVVLSSTNGPGFPLNGTFSSQDSLPSQQLSVN